MEHAAARARIAPKGQTPRLRPATRAVAAIAEFDRWTRYHLGRAVPDAEVRLGAAGARIPVTDLYRVSAVLCDVGAVHRELARPASGADSDVRRSHRPAANPANSKRNRGAPRRVSAHRDYDQLRCRHRHRPDLRDHWHTQPGRLGALAATLNFFPIIGPIAMFVVLTLVGIIAFPTLDVGLMAPLAFAGLTFLEGHFVTPTIIGRRLELNALAVFIALAFWTWLWGPMGGFLSSPLLIVGLILKEHLMPEDSPQLPQD